MHKRPRIIEAIRRTDMRSRNAHADPRCFGTLRHASVWRSRETGPEASRTTTPCASVNLDVLRGFEPGVSHSYHNRVAHLALVAQYSSALVVRSVAGAFAHPQQARARKVSPR